MGDGEGLSQPLLYTLVVAASLLLLAGLVVLCLAYRRRQDEHPGAGAGLAKASRHGNQLDIKQDQCYVVSYTLKSAADCASERKPDILETPRGNGKDGRSGTTWLCESRALTRPESANL